VFPYPLYFNDNRCFVSAMKRRGGMGMNLTIGIAVAFGFVFLIKFLSTSRKSSFSPLAVWF
jgi:lipopolysaccharide export system permease protein